MQASLVERAGEQAATPPRFLPRRKIHVLPRLREHQAADVRPPDLVAQGAEDGHLAELVVERDAAIRPRRRIDDDLCVSHARCERLLAEEVRPCRQRLEADVHVGRRRSGHDHGIEWSGRQRRVERCDDRNLVGSGRAVASRRIRIDADGVDAREARQCGKVEVEPRVAEAEYGDSHCILLRQLFGSANQ